MSGREESQSQYSKGLSYLAVLISSLIRRGKPHELILRIDGIEVRLVSSSILKEELTSVLTEEKVARYVSSRDVDRFLRYIGKRANLVKVRSKFWYVLCQSQLLFHVV